MFSYILRRIVLLIPTLIGITVVAFIIIELPPGDYLTAHVMNLAAGGDVVDQEQLEALKRQYGLDLPLHLRYLHWMGNILKGDFGRSFEWNMPVSDLIWERLALTLVITVTTLLFTWVMGFAIGVYSATHQYSFLDYLFTSLGFVGLGTPDFMIALVLLWLAFSLFGVNLTGLFSQEFQSAPWSIAKVIDMFKHMWVPLVILGTGGTAGMARTMRANLLDELQKPYVETGRAKGLKEWRLVFKYPVRVALNPFISTAGWALPGLINGATIVSVVLGLPTTGPLLLRALLGQDMYLAASFVLLLSVLTVIGTLISDILLAFIDPRIRYGAH
ncbi:MAG TPA: ABC transporter permease [Anaerolineae bacterium]|nr:ABC transporter permease [Anaerolineae bacterium]HQI84344.1 ABC transporter permease [Anaerolineae bacterium]